jgi:RNA polymerase-binding transcription factor DksA
LAQRVPVLTRNATPRAAAPRREADHGLAQAGARTAARRDHAGAPDDDALDARGGRPRRDVEGPVRERVLPHDDELAAITVDRLARDLKLVDRAIADIDAGRYGVCVECEERIGPKRLKALPFATRCVECQARSERLARVA